MQRNFLSLFACLLLVCGFAVLSAQAATEKEEFHQSYNLSTSGSLTLKNVNGAVVIKAWDQPRVEVNAVKSSRNKENLALVKIDIKAQSDRVDIDTIYPKEHRNLDVSVSYEITVPRSANLEKIQTVNGSIEIGEVVGRVKTETVNGSINIDGGNVIGAETVNGSIKAKLSDLGVTTNVKFETVNGSVTLFLPTSLNAELEAATVNGKINSDLPITVQGELSKHHLHGRIGSGGARLNLETVNGSITLSQGNSQAN